MSTNTVEKKQKYSNRYSEVSKIVDKNHLYEIDQAIDLLKKSATAKFNESIDLAVRLGIDTRKSDQNVRGITTIPHGTGKKKTIAVLAKGDQAAAAEKAGAEFVGSDDLIAKIQAGYKDFDVILAAEDMAPMIGKIGRILGTKTPNKRNGTVTNNIEQAVNEIKAATRIEYRADKSGVVHLQIGKINFSEEQIRENFLTALETILKAKPSSSKGKYLLSITLSTTMGPGIHLDTILAQKTAEAKKK